MFTTAVGSLLTALIKNLPEDLVKEGLDKLLDFVENKVYDSDNQFDDLVVIPLINVLRTQLNVTEEEGSEFEDE